MNQKKRSESLQDRDLTSTTKSIWMTDMTPHCFAGIGRLIHSAPSALPLNASKPLSRGFCLPDGMRDQVSPPS